VINEFTAADTKETMQLARDLKAGNRKVFFYAASSFDWQPLHRFTHLCDTFVYVDPRVTEAAFDTAKQQLVNGQTKVGAALLTDRAPSLIPATANYTILTDAVGELSEMRDEPWTDIQNLHTRQGWGAVLKLKRRVGGVDQVVWLVYIAGTPLVAYQRLFIENGLVPEFLAIGDAPRREGAPPGYNARIQREWERTFSWDGEFGQLLRDNNAQLPSLLSASDALAWPANPPRYLVRGWARGFYDFVVTTGKYVWHDPIPAANPAQRHITVTRKRLTPQAATASGAVVLSDLGYENFRPARWPQNALIIREQLEEPQPPAEPPFIPPPNVLFHDLAGKPLLQVLHEVEQMCAERGITSVAIQGLWGFEDEADDLAWWRQQSGQIKKLVLHFDCYGHFFDYAKAADVIG
jgi:hypothetical protein